MTDVSSMSDADLLTALKRPEKTAAPKGVADMSDDDLMAALKLPDPAFKGASGAATGPGALTRAAIQGGRMLYKGLQGVDKYAEGFYTGERDPMEEGPKLALGLVSPSAGVARAAVPAQVFPRAADPERIAGATRLAEQPIIGAPIRRAAQAATEEYGRRVAGLGERVAGADPVAAGAAIRGPLHNEAVAQDMISRMGIRPDWMPQEVLAMARADPIRVVPKLIDIASSRAAGADKVLGQVRALVDPKVWPQVENAIIHQLGARAPTSPGGPPVFDVGAALTNFNALSEAGKNLLVSPGTRRYLESMINDAFKVERLSNLPTGPTAAGIARTGMKAAAVAHPITALPALGMLLGSRMRASWLAEPATAASLSAWSNAYTKLMLNAGPKEMAGFVIATRNLSNTTGEAIDPTPILRELSPRRTPTFPEAATEAIRGAVANPSGRGSSFVPPSAQRVPADLLRAMGGEPGRGSVMAGDPRVPPAPPSGATQPSMSERIDEFIRGRANPQREAPPEPEAPELPLGWHTPPGRMGQHWARTPEGQWIRHNEQAFQRGIRDTPWFKEFVQRHGEEPNLNDPDYDYRRAWSAGARPNVRDPGDGEYHWPSQFKGPNHPNRFVNGVDTRTGRRTAPMGEQIDEWIRDRINPQRFFDDDADPAAAIGEQLERRGFTLPLSGRRSENIEQAPEDYRLSPTEYHRIWRDYKQELKTPLEDYTMSNQGGLADIPAALREIRRELREQDQAERRGALSAKGRRR